MNIQSKPQRTNKGVRPCNPTKNRLSDSPRFFQPSLFPVFLDSQEQKPGKQNPRERDPREPDPGEKDSSKKNPNRSKPCLPIPLPQARTATRPPKPQIHPGHSGPIPRPSKLLPETLEQRPRGDLDADLPLTQVGTSQAKKAQARAWRVDPALQTAGKHRLEQVQRNKRNLLLRNGISLLIVLAWYLALTLHAMGSSS